MTLHFPQPEPVKLARLHLADYNPRSIAPDEMARLKRSLREFGFVQPLIARRADGLMIGGHQRLTALGEMLKEDGLTPKQIAEYEAPTILLDIDDDRAKALNLALNKIGGEWDYEKLAALTAELDPVFAEIGGFTESEIADIQSLHGPDLEPPPGSTGGAAELDAELTARARRFAFNVASDADAALVRTALERYGMTGPKDTDAAFVNALRAALAAPKPEPAAQPDKRVPVKPKAKPAPAKKKGSKK